MADRAPGYRTGNALVDDGLAEIAEAVISNGVGAERDRQLLFEILVSAARMGTDSIDRADRKLVNRALKELRYAFEVFGPYEGVRKVSIFGSARTKEGQPAYERARSLATAMVEKDWMVITGAGPGIMAAGNQGAGAANSFGVNIKLPFEAGANRFIQDDPKLVNFRYFFTRKVTFMKESHGFALFPGGFGTMDEAFELLTLMQTGRTYLAPVVLVDPPESTYWETWIDFVRRELGDTGLISPTDLALVEVAHSTEDAVEALCRFYRTFHSMRFVGRRLVVRMTRLPDAAEVNELNANFADLIEGDDGIEVIGATDAEVADDDHVDLPRLAFRFDFASYSRLRQLIDALNDATP